MFHSADHNNAYSGQLDRKRPSRWDKPYRNDAPHHSSVSKKSVPLDSSRNGTGVSKDLSTNTETVKGGRGEQHDSTSSQKAPPASNIRKKPSPKKKKSKGSDRTFSQGANHTDKGTSSGKAAPGSAQDKGQMSKERIVLLPTPRLQEKKPIGSDGANEKAGKNCSGEETSSSRMPAFQKEKTLKNKRTPNPTPRLQEKRLIDSNVATGKVGHSFPSVSNPVRPFHRNSRGGSIRGRLGQGHVYDRSRFQWIAPKRNNPSANSDDEGNEIDQWLQTSKCNETVHEKELTSVSKDPLPGSEEARNNAIKEATDRLKQALKQKQKNNVKLNELLSSGDESKGDQNVHSQRTQHPKNLAALELDASDMRAIGRANTEKASCTTDENSDDDIVIIERPPPPERPIIDLDDSPMKKGDSNAASLNCDTAKHQTDVSFSGKSLVSDECVQGYDHTKSLEPSSDFQMSESTDTPRKHTEWKRRVRHSSGSINVSVFANNLRQSSKTCGSSNKTNEHVGKGLADSSERENNFAESGYIGSADKEMREERSQNCRSSVGLGSTLSSANMSLDILGNGNSTESPGNTSSPILIEESAFVKPEASESRTTDCSPTSLHSPFSPPLTDNLRRRRTSSSSAHESPSRRSSLTGPGVARHSQPLLSPPSVSRFSHDPRQKKIISDLQKMSQSKLKDLINNPRSGKLDFAMRELMKEHRAVLSRISRDTAEKRIPAEFLNPKSPDLPSDDSTLLADFAIDWSTLPGELICTLGDLFQDFNSEATITGNNQEGSISDHVSFADEETCAVDCLENSKEDDSISDVILQSPPSGESCTEIENYSAKRDQKVVSEQPARIRVRQFARENLLLPEHQTTTSNKSPAVSCTSQDTALTDLASEPVQGHSALVNERFQSTESHRGGQEPSQTSITASESRETAGFSGRSQDSRETVHKPNKQSGDSTRHSIEAGIHLEGSETTPRHSKKSPRKALVGNTNESGRKLGKKIKDISSHQPSVQKNSHSKNKEKDKHKEKFCMRKVSCVDFETSEADVFGSTEQDPGQSAPVLNPDTSTKEKNQQKKRFHLQESSRIDTETPSMDAVQDPAQSCLELDSDSRTQETDQQEMRVQMQEVSFIDAEGTNVVVPSKAALDTTNINCVNQSNETVAIASSVKSNENVVNFEKQCVSMLPVLMMTVPANEVSGVVCNMTPSDIEKRISEIDEQLQSLVQERFVLAQAMKTSQSLLEKDKAVPNAVVESSSTVSCVERMDEGVEVLSHECSDAGHQVAKEMDNSSVSLEKKKQRGGKKRKNRFNVNDDEHAKRTRLSESPEASHRKKDACSDDNSIIDDNILQQYLNRSPEYEKCALLEGNILDIKTWARCIYAASHTGIVYRILRRGADFTAEEFCGVRNSGGSTCIEIVVSPGSTSHKLYTGGADGVLRVYNMPRQCEGSLEVLKTPESSHSISSAVHCMQVNWGFLFIGTKAGHVVPFNIEKQLLGEPLTIGGYPVLALQTCVEGPRKVIIVACRHQPIAIRDAMSGLLLRSIGESDWTVYSLVLHENLVYCGANTDKISVFNFQTGALVKHLPASKGVIDMRLFGHYLFCGCYTGKIFVFNLQKSTCVGCFDGPGKMILCLAFDRRKGILCSSKDNGLVSYTFPAGVRGILNKISKLRSCSYGN